MKEENRRAGNRRPGSMLAVDLRRMFTWKFFYTMALLSAVLPVLITVMTNMAGAAEDMMFTNVWQAIGTAGSSVSMDMTSMCNINMIYFLSAVLICVFTAADFRSGYCKNLFSVRAKKADYIASKTITGFLAGAIMLLAYFAGALAGGRAAGLSFEMDGFSAWNIIMCMLAKIFLMAVFAAIYVLMGAIAKSRTWLSVLLSLFTGMFMFMVIPMMTPLTSGMMNVFMCLAGGVLFGAGLGLVSRIVLGRTDIV